LHRNTTNDYAEILAKAKNPSKAMVIKLTMTQTKLAIGRQAISIKVYQTTLHDTNASKVIVNCDDRRVDIWKESNSFIIVSCLQAHLSQSHKKTPFFSVKNLLLLSIIFIATT